MKSLNDLQIFRPAAILCVFRWCISEEKTTICLREMLEMI
jgi:hypothetical protein